MTKSILIRKVVLFLMVIFAFVIIGGASNMVAAAGPANPADSCQGDAKTCVCPPDKKNCGVDPATTKWTLTGCSKDTAAADCNIITKYVNPLIKVLSLVVGLAIVIGIIVAGIMYSMSAGDPQKAAVAKDKVWKAVIALIAYLFLYALIRFINPGGGLTE